MSEHIPVMQTEVLKALNIKPNGIYIDATFGRGGHSSLILQNLSQDGRLIATDQDLTAVNFGKANFDDPKLELLHTSFTKLPEIIEAKNLLQKIDGILFDFGVSSPQLNQAERGFSFQQDGPLDMRMDQTQKNSAKDWLNTATEPEIAEVLWQFGGEKKSRQIAKQIVKTRAENPLKTTFDLVRCIKRVLFKPSKKHPATRTFQAIRIFINQELQQIKQILPELNQLLKTGGVMVAISFHSLEDKIIKVFLKPTLKFVPKEIPITSSKPMSTFKVTQKKLTATRQEILQNPRSRSAIMRVAVRVN